MRKGEMLMWLIIAASVLGSAAAGVVYLINRISVFGGIKMIAGDKKAVRYLIAFVIVAVAFIITMFAATFINALIILLHEVMFFLLFGGIMRLVTLISGKSFKIYWQGWLSLIACAAFLAVGYYLDVNVWQKDYKVKSDKNVTLKIALIADSHMGTTFDAEGFEEQLKRIEAQNPDLLVIAGDFVDDSSMLDDTVKACEALGRLNLKYGVYYSYGNHDKGYYNKRDFNAEDMEKALEENGVHVLKDDYILVDDSFYIVGRKDRSMLDRKDIDELLTGIDTDKYIIVLDHQPNDYEAEADSAADLVLSGHTHGGQFFPFNYIGEWFGINDATYGYERRNDTDFIVTSGISNWELLFKTGTRSEYVIIDVN